MSNTRFRLVSRRSWLHSVGVAAASVPLFKLSAACNSDDADDGDDGDCGPSATGWASGGTAAMIAKECYPDPFAAGVDSCALLVCETIAGPCTSATVDRRDVSDGYPGLPVRLALKFVTADTCAPIEGAVIEIWHTQVSGVYSGVTPDTDYCSGGDPDARNRGYFRGTQTTDADGRVDFDTCFPGWYTDRAIHIHVRVTIGDSEFIVTQLFFAEELIQEIFRTHVDYMQYGQPDTPNSTDLVSSLVPDLAPYVLDSAQMSDGAMLASKVVVIRSSLSMANCSVL